VVEAVAFSKVAAEEQEDIFLAHSWFLQNNPLAVQ
jgi:hypothetical protein